MPPYLRDYTSYRAHKAQPRGAREPQRFKTQNTILIELNYILRGIKNVHTRDVARRRIGAANLQRLGRQTPMFATVQEEITSPP